MRATLLAALAALVALGLSACGGHDGSHDTSDAKPAEVDRAFVAEMIPHHEAAVEMAEIATERGESPFVKTLAADIIETQTAEIETLRAEDAQLEEEGVRAGDLGVPHDMTGMDMDVTSLKTATPFDRAFLEMMIPHHEGAVTMAKAELDKGSDPELKRLAEQIIATQEKEIAAMESKLGGAAGDAHDMEGHGG